MDMSIPDSVLTSVLVAAIIACAANMVDTKELLTAHEQRIEVLEHNQQQVFSELSVIKKTLIENSYTLKDIQRNVK